MKLGNRAGWMAACAAGISAAIVALSVATFGPAAQGWLLAARYTARFSFAVFLAAFLGPRWVPHGLGDKERALIVSFGAAHGVHLLALITYRMIDRSVPAAAGIVVGGLGYALLALLVVLVARRSADHRFRAGVLHYLLAVFVITYASKISTADQHWAGILGVCVGGAGLLLRHATGRVHRSQEPRTASN